MKKLFAEFKAFLMQGNVLDLAVAVAIGAAFKAIVDALVADLVNPLIGLVVGENSFDSATAKLGSCNKVTKVCKGELRYGHFIGQIVNFVIIAAVIFVIIKSFERMQNLRKNAAGVEAVVEAEDEQTVLLREIRDSLASR